MALWVYKKYRKGYSAWSSESKRTTSSYVESYNSFLANVYSSEPYWSESQGRYITVGTPSNSTEGWWVENYELSASKIFSYDMFQNENGTYGWWSDVYTRSRTETEPVYVGEVIAEDGTYPDDGWADGYYYKKDRLAWIPPDMKVRVDGSLKTYENGWVKINGVLRQIDKAWARVSGQLKDI